MDNQQGEVEIAEVSW